MKRCITCNFVKPFVEFYSESKSDKLKNECKSCLKDRSLKRQLMTAYGITKEEKEEMVRMQGNRCALCGIKFLDTKEINVDHCHTNGGIRGILCRHCNVGLGHFKDSTKLLRRAIKYLQDYAQTITTPSVPAGHYPKSEEHTKHGTVLATGSGEDDDYPHHHCGTISREDLDHRTEESSGDGVAHRNKKVEPSRAFTRSQDNGEPEPEISRVEIRGGRLFD